MVIQNWSVSTDGGYLSNVHLSKKMREWLQPTSALEQFVVEGEPVIGSDKGDTINFNRAGNLSQEYSTVPITELDRTPDTSFAISQGSLKIDEYGVAVKYTDKLERLSDFNPKDLIQKRLMQHMGKTNNMLIYNALVTTKARYVPVDTTYSTNWDLGASITKTAGHSLTAADLFEIKAKAIDYYHMTGVGGKPGSTGTDLNMVCTETLLQVLLQDTTIKEAFNYAYSGTANEHPQINGFRFKWNGFNIIVDNQALSPTLGAAATYKSEAFIFGADPVVRRTLMPPTVIADPTEDLGRFKRIGWRGIWGLALPWGSTAQDVTDKQVSVIRVCSS